MKKKLFVVGLAIGILWGMGFLFWNSFFYAPRIEESGAIYTTGTVKELEKIPAGVKGGEDRFTVIFSCPEFEKDVNMSGKGAAAAENFKKMRIGSKLEIKYQNIYKITKDKIETQARVLLDAAVKE